MAKAKKLAKLPVWKPKDKNQCAAGITRLGELQRELKKLELDMQSEVALVAERYQPDMDKVKASLAQYLEGIETWCTDHRDELLTGEAKSVDLVTGVVSWRKCPPAIHVANTKQAISYCQQHHMTHYLNFTAEINKEALLKKPADIEKIPGISLKAEREMFSVEPVGDIA